MRPRASWFPIIYKVDYYILTIQLVTTYKNIFFPVLEDVFLLEFFFIGFEGIG